MNNQALGTSASSFTVDHLHRILGFTMSDEQLAAVTADLDRPLLVVAGAGSGKTTVMAARVLWAVATGQVNPQEVVGLTFTRKAAGELGARVRHLLDVLMEDFPPRTATDLQVASPLVSTYHSFAHQFVAEHGLRIGVEPGAALLSETGALQLAYRVLLDTSLPLADMSMTAPVLAEVVVKLDQQLAEHIASISQLREHEKQLLDEIDGLTKTVELDRKLRDTTMRRLQLCDVVEEFRAEKVRQGVVDFADVLRLGHQLAARSDVQELVHDRYRMILLDEYQDTSVVQAEFLAPMIGEVGSVTAVGDPLQAIYGWRGAGANAMTDFAHHFGTLAGSRERVVNVLPLSVSQRSGPTVLAVANEVAAPLRTEASNVVLLRPGTDNEGNPRRDGVRAAAFETYREEVRWLGDRIAEQLQVGTPLSRIAVLCRAKSDFAAVVDELRSRNIPTVVSGSEGLLAQPEVIDVISMLEVVNDPTNNPAILRLLMGPRFRIGPRDLAILGRRATDLAQRDGLRGRQYADDRTIDFTASVNGIDKSDLSSLAEAIDDLGVPADYPLSLEGRRRIGQLAHDLRDARDSRMLPLADLVSRVISITGLDVEARLAAMTAESNKSTTAQRSIAAIQALYELLNLAQESAESRALGGFLSWVSVMKRVKREPEFDVPVPSDAVAVMTVHKSKGLEWDVVAVPFLSSSVFPSGKSSDRWTSNVRELPYGLRGDRDSLPEWTAFGTAGHRAFNDALAIVGAAEERRLGYVAVTRPTRLLLASGHWWGPTQTRKRGPSHLLVSVREQVTEPLDDDPWVPETSYEENPQTQGNPTPIWPPDLHTAGRKARVNAADLVNDVLLERDVVGGSLTESEESMVDDWDRDIDLLVAERRERGSGTHLAIPRTLSASDFMALQEDKARFLERRARPMPQKPSPAATRGTRFHTWVEEHLESRPMFEELPGAIDEELFTEADLVDLRQGFLATEYADLPPYALEVPFSVVIEGVVLKGRIDAVYRRGQRWEVVDWKTNRRPNADHLQLAIYRYAWAQMLGIPVSDIDGVFVYVRMAKTVRFNDLPAIPELLQNDFT